MQCERYYPAARGRIAVLRFAVRVPEVKGEGSPEEVRVKHGLPAKYLFFPGQLWKHKNHLGVIAAVGRLVEAGRDVVVVMSGGFDDYRNPGHATEVLAEIDRLHLCKNIRVLGHIPYGEMVQLLRGSIAMVNPSFSEGWSTTVEEAKALAVPLVLSSLAVHREQAGTQGLFFDPSSPEAIAGELWRAWCSYTPGPTLAAERVAGQAATERWMECAAEFASIATRTAAS